MGILMSRSVVFLGELLLRLGAPGRQLLLQSPQLEVHVGGAEANVAVALARLGHRAAMVSCVPDNPLGEAALGELRRHGVETVAVQTAQGRMGLYFLVNGALQRAPEVIYDRAGSSFALADPARYDWPVLLQGAAGLHVSGVTPAVGPNTAAAALAAMETAAQLDLPVAFDGNYRSKLWEAWASDPPTLLRGLVQHATLLFASHRDIEVLLGLPVSSPADARERFVAAAQRAFAAFPRLQRMTGTLRTPRSVDHHALSAIMLNRDGKLSETAAVELTPIVDRIGTGDAFAAGVWHGLLHAQTDAKALQYGLAAGCIKHGIPGDLGLLTPAQLEAFIADAGFDVKR
jgi:2-dehydro-3-deoxygluconokinase